MLPSLMLPLESFQQRQHMPIPKLLQLLNKKGEYNRDDLQSLLGDVGRKAGCRCHDWIAPTILHLNCCAQHSHCRYRRAVLPPILIECGDVDHAADNGMTTLQSLCRSHQLKLLSIRSSMLQAVLQAHLCHFEEPISS